MIGGLATVLGGVSKKEFLSSVEVLDNSQNAEAPLGYEWRITAHTLSVPRYDFALAVAPISSLPVNERRMDQCADDDEIIET